MMPLVGCTWYLLGAVVLTLKVTAVLEMFSSLISALTLRFSSGAAIIARDAISKPEHRPSMEHHRSEGCGCVSECVGSGRQRTSEGQHGGRDLQQLHTVVEICARAHEATRHACN